MGMERSANMEIQNMLETITVNTQSSIRIAATEGIVYLDPLEIGDAPHDADFILITHDHYDHFSPSDIRKVAGGETVLVVPQKMEKQAQELRGFVGSIVTVRPGEALTVKGLALETVPAYNNIKPFHPQSVGWVGYILITDGIRIYAAGDTDATRDNRRVRCDIAMVPIGGTYTMTAKNAAGLINEIRPAVAIPIHYGSIVGSAADAETFAELIDPEIRVVLKLSF